MPGWADELCPVQERPDPEGEAQLAGEAPVIIRCLREDAPLSHSLWPGQECASLPPATVSPGWDNPCILN